MHGEESEEMKSVAKESRSERKIFPGKSEAEKDREMQELADKMIEHVPKNITAIVGDDETTRREKAMGLKINPETGRAYESQGGFQNMGLGASGHFYDGKAVPRIAQCAACEARVMEHQWGQGFENCGALDFSGQFFLCSECVGRVLNLFPRIKAIVKAMHGGDLRRG